MLESENAPTSNVAYDYAKFPREFLPYRWYKPILVALLAFLFYIFMMVALVFVVLIWSGGSEIFDSITGTYEDTSVYTGPGALFELGLIALMLPSIALAALIVRDRPFSSYSTSRGGWNWKTFFLCVLVAAAIMAIDFIIELLVFPIGPVDGTMYFTSAGLVMCIILVPFQCVAEEYLFRGFLMQAIGSWTKLPVVAIIASAIIFAAGHPYNSIGIIAVFFNGVFWGFLAWKTKGLEATCAIHIVNNYIAFLGGGFGLTASTSVIPVESLVISLLVDVVYVAVVLVAGKRFGWFEPKGDGVATFNEKVRAKHAHPQQDDTVVSSETSNITNV